MKPVLPGIRRIGRKNGIGSRRHAYAISVILACCACLCRNPFFPPIGTPDKLPPLRSTPSGVFTQLIQAYELQRIDLFEDLLPIDKTFRFYVSPRFEDTYKTRPYGSIEPEPRDTLLQYTTESSTYYYWGQDQEIQSHKHLFTRAESITFKVKPSVSPGKFRYIINDDGDTTNVEVLMENGEILIRVNISGVTDEYPIWIEKQVFLLERDAENLWVIRKWYDFGSQP
ncbi:MAG: hypothetical protein JXA71_16235 [Chitinispirillaceae bacterium]|nr:hypothetical protein [Chitinispirillaceae bacterium]